jgi:hypothetical protein
MVVAGQLYFTYETVFSANLQSFRLVYYGVLFVDFKCLCSFNSDIKIDPSSQFVVRLIYVLFDFYAF